ncbi:MAG: small multi-drug export protein [Ruminococcaceae bacterium]|nr:small multi-drug export protein [Oscillospiraceae bacterium]
MEFDTPTALRRDKVDFVKEFLISIPIPLWMKAFFASMIPFIESRYAILFFTDMGMEFWQLFLVSVIGNMVPVPFIILLFRPIVSFFLKTKMFKKLGEKLDDIAHKKASKLKKVEGWGLFIFVALPLPGTGAISGALASAIFNMRISKALPVIFAGTVVATSITTGALEIITNLITKLF